MSVATESELVWRALSDTTRRELLDALAISARTTGELCEEFGEAKGLCRTAIMKHLDVLEAAGLVIVKRVGRTRWNYLNPVPIREVCDRWVSRQVRGLAASLSRLKEVVEHDEAKGDPSWD